MTRGFASLLTAVGLLWLGAAPVAQAQTLPAAQTETWLGCPAGHALETALDPRVLPATASLQAPATRLVVRCVARSIPELPICPAGLRVVAAFGADRCAAPRSSTSATMGDGSVRFISDGASDGTSNTVMMSELTSPPPPPASASSGAGLTTSKGTGTITARPSVPGCIAPRRLVVDPAGSAIDSCELTSIALPADRVPLPAR